MMKSERSCWRLAGAGLIAALAVLAVASTPASAGTGPGCSTGTFCYWSDTNYSGQFKLVWDESVAGSWVGSHFDIRSAKNKFGNRRVQMQTHPDGFTRCLDPGEVDPVVAAFGAFKIGAPGSRC